MQFPIRVGLRRSRFMVIAAVLVHGTALTAVLATAWPMALSTLLACLVVGHGLWALRTINRYCYSLRLYADGQFAFGDDLTKYVVSPGSYVHPWLTVFRFRGAGGRLRSVVVLPDSTSFDEARQLRLWLRWKVSASGDGDV